MAADGLRFRTATPSDVARVLGSKRTAIHERAGWQYSTEQVDAWALNEHDLEDFAATLDHEGFDVVVAERDEAVVG